MTWETALRRLARFARDDSGATAIEYAMIAVGIAVAIAVTVYQLGDVVLSKYYGRIATELPK
ncbi:pilus assembly protein Flp/PilA [Methylopila jiangsuensis]|nr:Flp family type IVb pilin [Methylopila jiangsuensis]MDR6284458.1 pilus assembly protein Flp/PilA [Methylopila jiangsuensis]